MDTVDAQPGNTLHHFQFPCGLVPPSIIKEMASLSGITPLLSTGLIIEIRTKDKGCLLNLITESILNSLKFSKLIDTAGIRQMIVTRFSSFEESVDVHIVALDE